MVNTISSNYNIAMRPAQIQARSLKGDPDAFNEFADSVLQSRRFLESSGDEAKQLASMARSVAQTMPDSKTRFKLYEPCLNAALDGTLSAAPGGASALLAKLVLGMVPGLDPFEKIDVLRETLLEIDHQDTHPDAQAHADFGLIAGNNAGKHDAATAIKIWQNSLGVIANFGDKS